MADDPEAPAEPPMDGDIPELTDVWNGDLNQPEKKVKSKENVLSSGYMFTVYEVKRENHMLTQLKPLLFIIRLMFKFPYVIDVDGRLYLRVFTVWSAVTLVGYLAQGFLAVELMYHLFQIVSVESDFITIVKIGVNIICVVSLLYTPLSALMEWKEYCIYLNQWIELQVDFEEITGKPFTTHMGLLIKIAIGVLVVQAYVAVYMGTNTLTQPYWYHKYVYMMVFLSLPQQLFMWVICQYESGRMGGLLKDYISSVFGSDSPENNAQNAFKVRMLWLRLVYTVKLLGHAAFTIIVLLVTGGIVFLTGTYVIVTGLINGDPRTNEFVGPVLVSSFIIMIISEFSHRTTQQVGTGICEALTELKSASMDEETTAEVERFLRIAAFNAPSVSVAGLAVIDRSTLVSISKNVITYLIVLIQFELNSNEDNAERVQKAANILKNNSTTMHA